MLKTLRDLFQSLALPDTGTTEATEHDLQVAAAVLLVEVMRAEGSFDAQEREAVLLALREKFGLQDDEAARIAEMATSEAQSSTDLYAYTSLVNERFDMARKVHLVELLWRVAYADGRLGDHERHVVWRLSDLLHVPQGAYVHARLRAQAESERPGPSVLPSK